MNSRLRRNQPCPLHNNSRFCCGRESRTKAKAQKFPSRNGVTQMPGDREVCTPAVLRRRKDILIRKHPFCAACEILDPDNAKFTEYDQIELAHRESKGNGGFKHDDSWPNLCLMHKACNREQGSRSFDQYIADKQLAERVRCGTN